MKTWLITRLTVIRESYWLVPSCLVAAAVALAYAAMAADRIYQGRLPPDIGWLYGGGPDGARAILSTVAGSMITIAGVTFSITIVALSLASSQFGPRLLRNFMRDRGNQVVLGTFVATFLYCLLVLREVRSVEEAGTFVPSIAVTIAVLLAVLGIGVLIYFIHHVASSIHAENVVAQVARELQDAIDLFCAGWGAGADVEDSQETAPPRALDRGLEVAAQESGYVRAVDHDGLFAWARENDLVVQLLHRAGDLVIAGSPLARVARVGSEERAEPDEEDRRFEEGESAEAASSRVRGAFVMGAHRTAEQDVEFSLRQIVEVALRALSPGVNDPFTAITCVDWLGVALARLAGRGIPSRVARDDEGRARLFTDSPSFAGIADAAFDQIRQAAAGNVAVSVRLLETLGALSGAVREPDHAEALRRHATRVLEQSLPQVPVEDDRRVMRARYAAAMAALGGIPSALAGD